MYFVSPLLVVVMKCVSTELPSMPRHSNVSYGSVFWSFQLIFVVMNVSISLWRRICGRAAE